MNATEFTKQARPRVLSQKRFNKLFCIGANKTGTSTLETVLRLYGYDLPNQQLQEARLTEACGRNDYSELKDFCQKYDAFQDLPFSHGFTFIAADALFPNSRFILTERDPEDWFRSVCSFHKKVFQVEDLSEVSEEMVKSTFRYIYPEYMHMYKQLFLTEVHEGRIRVRWDLLYNQDYYISEYLARNNAVKKYFSRSQEKLLVIDITQQKTTTEICRFLSIPGDITMNMPIINKT